MRVRVREFSSVTNGQRGSIHRPATTADRAGCDENAGDRRADAARIDALRAEGAI
jgi:hypothetical protein